MTSPAVDPAAQPDDARWLRRAALLVGAVLAARLLCIALVPLDLVPDEAYYWTWSRVPDWCYYSKPPMVAWLIWASTHLLGTTAFSVRLPAALLNAGKVRYVWVTLVPLVFIAITTIYAGILNITDNFLPLSREPGKEVLGWVNVTLTAVILFCVIVVLAETARRAWRVLGQAQYFRAGRRVEVVNGRPVEPLTFGEA